MRVEDILVVTDAGGQFLGEADTKPTQSS
jgi:hypothetical protein